MSLPTIAIVGRPNVGKSSLLNALVGRRISIVDATPGVTRDRISVPCPLHPGQEQAPDGRPAYIELVDTGGMGIEDADDLTDHVEGQIRYALDAAALILFIVDAREGLVPLDEVVAEKLRRADTPVLLVANKIDQANVATEMGDLYRLGYGDPLPVSAMHKQGLGELRDAIEENLPDAGDYDAPQATMKLAVVGKRNAGKSTFINALAGNERVIVSETPGTTRDSVDVTVELDGRSFTLIDTAGFRKRRSLDGDIEFYSYHRALRSIRRADVVAFLIDASVPVSQVDKALAKEIAENHKPVVLVVNKWDLATDQLGGEEYADYFALTFPSLAFSPISLTTATDGLNLKETIELADELFDQARTRVTTGELNTYVREIVFRRGPSHKRGTRPPKIYYATQISTEPPTVACFVNDVRSFDANYERFFINALREFVPFAEVPFRVVFRPRKRDR